MIPTRYKAKLAPNPSYPVGAEALSEALAGVPHVESLSVSFSNRAVEPGSVFRRLLAARLPFRILSDEFRPGRGPGLTGSNDMLERAWYDERWELTVYAVLSELRHVANRLLREQGLPAVARWLRASTRVGQDPRPRRIELLFDPANGTLVDSECEGV